MQDIGAECRQKLIAAVKSAASKGTEYSSGKRALILSGGVDTCAVAKAAADAGVQIDLAITVVISEPGSDGEDVFNGTDEPYATLIATEHGYPHHIVRMTALELISSMLPFCVRVLECFDGMQLRNSMVVGAALHRAKELGCTQVLTGDAADELLGGYSFTWGSEEPEWSKKRADMVSAWVFSGPVMGQALGVGSDSPYMEKEFVQWALSTSKEQCVGDAQIHAKPGDKPETHRAGKLPLRQAYPEALSAWRRKDPIEKGSGSVALSNPEFWVKAGPEVFKLQGNASDSDLVVVGDGSDTDVAGLNTLLERVGKEGGVVLRDCEQLVNYREFCRQFPTAELPSRQRHGKDPCKACGWQLKSSSELFCHTCGAYPAQDLPA